jgi:mycothiol system anti-sigma-R factor
MNAEAQARCAETVKLLGEFLDRELSTCEIQTVQGHLDRCPPCLNVYRFEEKLKRLVRVHCEGDCAPKNLRDEILARLKQRTSRS